MNRNLRLYSNRNWAVTGYRPLFPSAVSPFLTIDYTIEGNHRWVYSQVCDESHFKSFCKRLRAPDKMYIWHLRNSTTAHIPEAILAHPASPELQYSTDLVFLSVPGLLFSNVSTLSHVWAVWADTKPRGAHETWKQTTANRDDVQKNTWMNVYTH